MNSHTNAFIIRDFQANDRKRRRFGTDPHEEPFRQRQRLALDLYDPDSNDRPDILNNTYGTARRLKCPQTALFTTAYIMDVCASKSDFDVANMDEIALASMFIAAKKECDNHTELRDALTSDMIRYFTEESGIDRLRLRDVEQVILGDLDHSLNINHPYRLFDRLSARMGIRSVNFRNFTRFFIDCCTMDSYFLEASPSRIVAASLRLSSDILNRKWTRQMSNLTGFTADELQQDVSRLLYYIRNIGPTSELCEYWSQDYRDADLMNGREVLAKKVVGRPSRRSEVIYNSTQYIVDWVFTNFPEEE